MTITPQAHPIFRIFCLTLLTLYFATAAFAQQEIIKSYLGSGFSALEQGQYSKAETLFRAAISEIDKTPAGGDFKTSAVIVALNGLSLALTNQGKHAEAETATRKQIAIMEQANKTGETDYATALNNLGLILSNQRKLAEAEEVHRNALTLRKKQLGSAHPDVAFSLLNLGKVYFDTGKLTEAEAVLRRALSIFGAIPTEAQTDENMIAVATCDMNLSSIKVRQGKFKEAEEFILLALMIRTGVQGAAHPDLIEPLRNYAILLRQMNRNKDAADLETRIRLIRAQNAQ